MILKNNRTMRAAVFLLALVLITSCFVGGTFAKYVTKGKGSDTARVAKFGVNIVAAGGMFSKTYAKDDTSFTLADNTVVSSDEDNLVAPGTMKTLGEFALTGSPEVAVRVKYTVDKFDLTGWTTNGTDEYCPLVFTVKGTTYKIGDPGINTAAELANKVKTAIENVTFDYEANTNLAEKTADNLTVSWNWPFSTSDENDVKDTALGKRAAANTADAGKIDFEVTMSVTQID